MCSDIRVFKIQRRERQRGRQKKTDCFNKQNNNLVRAALFFTVFSLPFYARLRRENAKFRVLRRT